jgi:hypothetical protein
VNRNAEPVQRHRFDQSYSANSGGVIAYASDKFSAMQTHAVFADISSWRSPPAHRMTLQPAA